MTQLKLRNPGVHLLVSVLAEIEPGKFLETRSELTAKFGVYTDQKNGFDGMSNVTQWQ